MPGPYGAPAPYMPPGTYPAPGPYGAPAPYGTPVPNGVPGPYSAPAPYGVPGYYGAQFGGPIQYQSSAPPPYSAFASSRPYFFIRSRQNGLVLDIEGGNPAPGTPVIVWKQKETDNSNQLWFEDQATRTIRSKLNEYCLDVGGPHIVLQPYQPGNPNQLWERSSEVIRNCNQPNKVLAVDRSRPGAGGRIFISNVNQKKQQAGHLFDFQFQVPDNPVSAMAALSISQQPPRRRFHIVSEMHCKVLDIRGGNPCSGTEVIIWPKKSGYHANQLWYFDSEGVIRSALNDMALDSGVGGQHVRMMPCNGAARQQWRLVGNRIVNNAHECLDIRGESRKDGAEVISYRYKGSSNQHWRVEYE